MPKIEIVEPTERETVAERMDRLDYKNKTGPYTIPEEEIFAFAEKLYKEVSNGIFSDVRFHMPGTYKHRFVLLAEKILKGNL